MTPVVEEMPGNHPTSAPENAPLRPARRSSFSSELCSCGGTAALPREAMIDGRPNRPVRSGNSMLCPIPSNMSDSGSLASMQVMPSMPERKMKATASRRSRPAARRTLHVPLTRTWPARRRARLSLHRPVPVRRYRRPNGPFSTVPLSVTS